MSLSKKTLTMIVLLLVAIIVLAFYFLLGSEENVIVPVPTVNNCDSVVVELASIINKGDITKCVCLSDESQKLKCEADIKDINYYNEALGGTDDSLCEKITTINMKKACVNLIKSKNAFINSGSNN